MKKLFFSAVALVAFNSVSIANTIQIEEEKVKDEKAITFYLTKCDQIYLTTLLKAIELEFSNEDASDIAGAAYQVCKEKEVKQN